jgi:hypothetical protein
MDLSEKQTGYTDAGKHKVTVTCSDGNGGEDQKTITVTVTDENRPPELQVPRTVEVNEGEVVRIRATASDPDGSDVTITFGRPFAEDGTWQTKRGDVGSYDIKVAASDGVLETVKTVTVIVKSTNGAPIISGMQDVTVYEGDTITLRPRIRDPDEDKVTVKYSGWMNSDTKKTGYDDAGEYDVTITASDSIQESKESVHVIVLNKNRAPVITQI